MDSKFVIAGKIFSSRLLLGTASYPNLHILKEALIASKAEIATIAVRRISLKETGEEGPLQILKELNLTLLPNTAGCYSAKEAILTAKLAREALQTNWVKLEVIGDRYSLYPDNEELLIAARDLIKDGFTVLPYCNDDPVICKKLADLGCAAVMPLGAPIGSGMGIRNPHNLELIINTVKVPVIVDAGVGSASHVSYAMELGASGVLLNTAVAKAKDPVSMARAMGLAIEAGYLSFHAGRIPEKKFATPSTTELGKIKL